MPKKAKSDAEILRQLARGKIKSGRPHADLLERIAAGLDSDVQRIADKDKLYEIGKSAAESIAEMVAALNCDYDRLEELRKLREPGPQEIDNPDDLSNDELFAELAELESAAGDCESREDAEQRIQEDPLSVEVRSGWYTPGSGDRSMGDSQAPEEFCILLGTGGPAVRIRGELDGNNEPRRAWIEAQDWFLPWTEYHGDAISQDDLLTYCSCFYFGD